MALHGVSSGSVRLIRVDLTLGDCSVTARGVVEEYLFRDSSREIWDSFGAARAFALVSDSISHQKPANNFPYTWQHIKEFNY